MGEIRVAGNSDFEIDANDDSVQRIAPLDKLQRYEGIAFSTSGNIIAVAAAEANAILLFRRKANGLFEETPYESISAPRSNLHFPHDVAFAVSRDTELLAAVQRSGVISIWQKNRVYGCYGPDAAFEIRGPHAELDFSDGVAFVPPNNESLAACNYATNSVCFYRRKSVSPIRFSLEPDYILRHSSLSGPDGIAFSVCGNWLAVANHGNHSVSIFECRNGMPLGGELKHRPIAATTIEDRTLRHPHSVAFFPKTNHLIVTNAGANYFSVYGVELNFGQKLRWSQTAVMQIPFGSDGIFKEINTQNQMEGGPKGVAIHRRSLAICSPEVGIKIYSFSEHLSIFDRRRPSVRRALRLWSHLKGA